VDLGIAGKVALVMGASKGIGRGAAAALAREGARVAIASRSEESVESAASELAAETGAEVRGLAADTDDVDALPALVRSVQDDLGAVEILVTNTGGPPIGDPLGFARSDWEAAYRNLVLAPIALIEAALPAMRERRWGRIVNVTSLTTREPMPGFMLSNSHRMAAVGAFKTLAGELARDGILFNSVAPGRIATDRLAQGRPIEELLELPQDDVPVGRIGTVDEIGAAIAFLCSERASYICGVNLLVDGGLVRSV
jgi:3-oxoacyl-[acyl-carrier protein] reductase